MDQNFKSDYVNAKKQKKVPCESTAEEVSAFEGSRSQT